MSYDELAQAFRRTDALGREPIDRKGWTKAQWADDAQRIMSHIDGSASALKNGHIIALLALVREQQAKLDRVEALADTWWANFPSKARAVRAAITATEEGK